MLVHDLDLDPSLDYQAVLSHDSFADVWTFSVGPFLSSSVWRCDLIIKMTQGISSEEAHLNAMKLVTKSSGWDFKRHAEGFVAKTIRE